MTVKTITYLEFDQEDLILKRTEYKIHQDSITFIWTKLVVM